jgi:tripartite-type tricarboxylate transporter receptor subunit TctC
MPMISSNALKAILVLSWLRVYGVIVPGAVIFTALTAPADAFDFYAGKTVDFIVGNAPGGGFDIYARTIAQHLGRHIPGNPTIVVKNLPGAGGARAGHHINTVAPKDGLTIGAIMPGTIMGPLLDEKPDTSFDPAKVAYLGTANTGTYICVTLDHSKTKTFEQALTQKTIMGGIAAGNSTNDIANLVKKMTGAQFDLVSGYKGTLDVALAIERGELDGVCGWNWSSAKSQKPDWIGAHKLNFLAQIGLQPNPELTQMGAPEIWNYIKNDESRKVMEVVVSQQAFERPYFTAQGTPSDRVATLRTAFEATMHDPQFLADAGKMSIDVSPLPGAQLQEMVQKLYNTPKAVLEQAKRAIRP